jgi:hypothetical protein
VSEFPYIGSINNDSAGTDLVFQRVLSVILSFAGNKFNRLFNGYDNFINTMRVFGRFECREIEINIVLKILQIVINLKFSLQLLC